jgi:PAS domain S-box-containing protein
MRFLTLSRVRSLIASPPVQPAVVGILFVIFTLASRLFVVPPEVLSPVWVATGILMFALLRASSLRMAEADVIAAFLGSLAGNCLSGFALQPSAVFSVVNCFGGVLGAVLLRRKLGPSGRLDSIRNLGTLIIYGAGLANGATAVIGAAVVSGFDLGTFGPAWVMWTLSNGLGVLMVVPLASALADVNPAERQAWSRLGLEAALTGGAILFAIFLPSGHDPNAFHSAAQVLVFPLLVWVGLRFSLAGAALSSFAVAFLVMVAELRGLAASAANDRALYLALIQLQVLLIMAVISSLVPAVVLAERRRAERALEEGERHFQFAIRAAGAGSWSWQIGSEDVVLGPEASRIFALGTRPHVSQILERIAPEHRARVNSEWFGCSDDTARDCATTFPLELPDSSTYWVELKGQRVEHNGVGLVYGIVLDVTESKRAEQALQRRTSELESLLTHSPIGFAFFDREHRFLRVSDALAELAGVPPEAHLGRQIGDLDPVNARQVDPLIDEVFRTGHVLSREIAGEKPKQPGIGHHWLAGFYPVFGEGPEPVAVGTYVLDVTDRKLAEQALRTSEERFRAVAEHIPQIIWVMNDELKFEYLSPKWFEYTGMSLQESSNGGWGKCVHEQDLPRVTERLVMAQRTRGSFEAEFRIRRHDGEYHWHLARAVPICQRADNKMAWFGTTTDIEDQKRSQQALIRSEKLAATGRLAASIAHEINNPLAGALNSIYLVSLDQNLSETTRGYIDMAQHELARVAHMTKLTLGFYRETGKPVKLDLRQVADSVIELYAPRLRSKQIAIDRQYFTAALVNAVEGEVRQIISNLVSNSIDAVPQGGRICLRIAGPVQLDQNRPAVRLTVSDNGSGIEPEHLKDIFEPFFSTKEATGTGLGLWVTQQLVRKHEGKIRGRSKPGQGTVFQVVFPLERRSEGRVEDEMKASA